MCKVKSTWHSLDHFYHYEETDAAAVNPAFHQRVTEEITRFDGKIEKAAKKRWQMYLLDVVDCWRVSRRLLSTDCRQGGFYVILTLREIEISTAQCVCSCSQKILSLLFPMPIWWQIEVTRVSSSTNETSPSLQNVTTAYFYTVMDPWYYIFPMYSDNIQSYAYNSAM